jgi:alkylation response protein AidB-like acyl-CoA dehydrogenase
MSPIRSAAGFSDGPSLLAMSITRLPDLGPSVGGLSSQADELRQRVRGFAENAVRPRIAGALVDQFDFDLVRQGHDAGLLRLAVPKEYGGLGYGVLDVAVALEELAAVCARTALIFGATMLGQAPVLLSDNPRLRAWFLPLFSGDEPVLACTALTEDTAGCGVTAMVDEEHYVLNGRKRLVANVTVAHYVCVYATVDGFSGGCFIVKLDSAGVTRGVVSDRMGYRACLGTELRFSGVRVPAENVLGEIVHTERLKMARGVIMAWMCTWCRGPSRCRHSRP